MENKVYKSRLAGVPAWALSVLTLIAIIVSIFIQDHYGMKRELAGEEKIVVGPFKLVEIADFLIFFILIPTIIFFICRIHPKSVWYTPLICNLLGFVSCCILIIDSIFDPKNSITFLDWIIWGGGSILSIAAAIIGARIGRRKNIHIRGTPQ